jgi:phosphopentomutase
MKPEYFVGRVIARPYVGTNKDNFKRIVGDRRDYAVAPSLRRSWTFSKRRQDDAALAKSPIFSMRRRRPNRSYRQ